jgi:hypothetical protein
MSKDRIIKVRFPNMAGDSDRTMTVGELERSYRNYLVIDPSVGEKVDLEKLADLEIPEVVVMPAISGG